MSNEVQLLEEGRVARIRLDRPAALHAVNAAMCQVTLDALERWRVDPAVDLVMIDHASGRGFCAGGDIRAAAVSGAADGVAARAFFYIEYQLNHRLFVYAKPTVAFMDGITMGGGFGIAVPCRYRVATENMVMAMPETAIGLFPDAGGGWHLSRLPGRIGWFLGLTSYRMDAGEACALGLATHYMPAERVEEAKRRIVADPQRVEVILDELAVPPPPARLIEHRAVIDRLFAGETLEAIVEALEADGSEWARATRETLGKRSPLSCKVTLRMLANGAAMTDFADEMRQEFAVSAKIIQRHDFVEGVRAVIVDKDNRPRWDPATPDAVTDGLIDQIFAPLPPEQAWMPS